MYLKSGISKDLKSNFILGENELIRISSVLDKASKTCNQETHLVFHVKREDNRFYETTSLDDVLADPNTTGKRVTSLTLELRLNKNDEWIAKVQFIAVYRFGFDYFRTDEIRFSILTDDKNWALLLADELEPQIDRTVNNKKLQRWPLFIIFAMLLYVISRFIIRTFDDQKIENSLYLITALSVAATMALTSFIRLQGIRGKADPLARLMGPDTVFLWGQQEGEFRDREQVRKNVHWTVVIGFIVSTLASIFVSLWL